MKRPEQFMLDHDGVLDRVVNAIEKKDFFRSILLKDDFDDWNLAKEFGKFLTLIEPAEIMGHAVLARACRHLGEAECALAELQECRARTPHPSERDLFQSFFEAEEQSLSRGKRG
jgi:hypothetical protein